MKRILLTTALAALLGAPAIAYAAEPAAPPADANWAGFYAGAATGYDFGHVKVTDLDGYNGPPPIEYNPNGMQIVAHGGYNWTFDPGWVLGLEAELGWFGFEGNAQYPPYVGVRGMNDSRASVDGNFLATATGRVGYGVGPWLLYGKGGFAGADIKTTYIDTDPTGTTLVAGTSQSDFRTGWTVGGGLEFMFPSQQMSARVEYDYYEFGDMTQTATSFGGSTWRFRNNVHSSAIKIGLTWHLGDEPF